MSKLYYDQDKHNYMMYEDNSFAEYIFSLIADNTFDQYDTAIEFGAGMGRFSTALISRFSKIILIEPAPAYAVLLKKKINRDHVEIISTTAEEFIQNHNIDRPAVVFCFHIMHHLKDNQRKLIYHFLKQTGSKGVFIEPNPINPLIFLQILIHPDMSFREEIEYLKLTQSKFKREFAKAYLTFENFKPICFFPPFVLNKLLRFTSKPVLKSFESLNRYFPFIFSYQMITSKV